MSIKIDKRSDDSAYIEVGDITIYVEHSEASPEHIHIWKESTTTNEIFHTYEGYVEKIIEPKNKRI